MMRRARVLFIGLLLVASVAGAQTPTPATFNPVPNNNASFLPALRTFLYEEDADRFDSGANSYQIVGCTHGTAGGLTGTFSVSCQAIVHGHYVYEPVTTVDYSAVASASDVCWLALHEDTTTAVNNWTRATGTHYLISCNNDATTRPALGTTRATIVERSTITASAITAVLPVYSARPSIRTFTNASEVTDSRPGQLWYRIPDAQLFFATGPSTLIAVVLGDVNGCAFCGTTASNFFSSGQIPNTQGGTGADSSGWTGFAKVTAGSWAPEATVSPAVGGFGGDVSACAASGGVPYWSATDTLACAYPDFTREYTPQQWSVDGVQCAHATNITLAASVPSDVVQCANNAAGVITVNTHLPVRYKDGEPVALRLTGVNNGSVAGDTGFTATCMCAVTEAGGSILTAANYAAPIGLAFTWSGSTSQIQGVDVTITCGGSCESNKDVFIKLTVDTTATTHASPTQIRYTNLAIAAAGDTLH